MPTFTEFKFKGLGADPEDAEQTCTLNTTDPLAPKLTIGSTSIPVTLEDEFTAALDAVDAEDATDGVDPDALRIGRTTSDPKVLGVEFVDDGAGGIIRYVKPPNQTVRWSMSKARDFAAGALVVRGGLGV